MKKEIVKAKVFTSNEVQQFLSDFPNKGKPLMLKVIIILGLFGCLRVNAELKKIEYDDVKKIEKGYLVYFTPAKTRTKNSTKKMFHIPKINQEFCPAKIIDIYISRIRPGNSNQFIKNFNVKGNCYVNQTGKDNLRKSTVEIAKLLNLVEPEKYTTHSIRRTSATLYVESGANPLQLKIFGRWKSLQVAEGYVENSLSYKEKDSSVMVKQIFGDQEDITEEPPLKKAKNEHVNPFANTTGNFSFSNCTFNFN